VPVAVVDELRTNISALTARQAQIDIDAAIAPALADGRLLPGAQETWARDLGKTNLAALTAYLATAQPIAALTSTQTNGNPPAAAANGAAQLSPEQLAVCSAMGLTPETFKAGAAA
jgi:phage I-like protein